MRMIYIFTNTKKQRRAQNKHRKESSRGTKREYPNIQKSAIQDPQGWIGQEYHLKYILV